MAIVGHHPETGLRISVERVRADASGAARDAGPPWRYEGEAVTPTARFRVAAVVEADGTVAIDLPGDAPVGLAEKARLIVRAAWKHAAEGEAPPPRRIVRWRADRG